MVFAGKENHAADARTYRFRLPAGAARAQAGAGRRRFSQRGEALRPDERPHVGRASPRLEGHARHRHQSAARAAGVGATGPGVGAAVRAARSCRRHRRHRLSRARGRRQRHARHRRRHQRRHARGRARAAERGLDDAITFVEGNAEALPFPDRSYDAVTIAFGIRNVPRIAAALGEAYRVLRIGGRFLCLEFSIVDVPGLAALYDFYSFNVIPALGRAVTGDGEAYLYLANSIRRSPRPDAFAEMMRAAGFARVSFQRMSGGIVALHSGWRL